MTETTTDRRSGSQGLSTTLKDRAKGWVRSARRRVALLDHGIRTVQHYGDVKGNLQAGAVTYFAFLSFFPILALAFFVVGYVAIVFPQAETALVEAINEVLPGIVGTGKGEVSLDVVRKAAAAVGIIGLLGVLYAGLGWLSAMRGAMLTVFAQPQDEQPNFVLGKLRDLVSLVVIGFTLVVSVVVSGAVTGFSQQILVLVDLGSELAWLVWLVGVAVGLVANMVLFFALFRLLGKPDLPERSLWAGALLGAVGFEILKLLSTFLISLTAQQPAFQAFGIALILLVWINYFSRVVVLAAAWAYTAPRARAAREAGADSAPATDQVRSEPDVAPVAARPSAGALVGAFAAGGTSALVAGLFLRHRRDG